MFSGRPSWNLFWLKKNHWRPSSVAVSAEIPLGSPQKLFIFIIKKNICWVKVSKNKIIYFWRKLYCWREGALNAASALSPASRAVSVMSALEGASRRPLENRSISLPVVIHHRHAVPPKAAKMNDDPANMGLQSAVSAVPKMRILTCDFNRSPITPENPFESWHSSWDIAWMPPIFCTPSWPSVIQWYSAIFGDIQW